MALIAVVLAALAGASVAAVTATGQSGHPTAVVEVDSVRPVPVSSPQSLLPPPSRLQAAASYLGISVEQLTAALNDGKSMGEIAAATPGKSESGLIQTLVEQRRERLAKAAETLPKRVKAAVVKHGGPGSGSGGGLLAVARAYLGVTGAQLIKELRSGKTLGSVAETTPGRSREGLSKALFAARERQLESAAQAGRLSESAARVRLSHIQRRVERVLSKTHRRSGPHKHGHAR